MRSGMNPYRPIRAEVVDVIAETPTIRTLRLRPDEKINFRPGQFIQLTVPGVGEAPFTPSSPSTWKDCMEVTVMRVGKVTEKVHQLKPGDIVGLRGPIRPGLSAGGIRRQRFDRCGRRVRVRTDPNPDVRPS